MQQWKRSVAPEDAYILLGVLFSICAIALAMASQGVTTLRVIPILTNVSVILSIWVLFIACLAIGALIKERPEKPSRFLIETVLAPAVRRDVPRGLPLALALAIFMPQFSMIKSGIPLLHPYDWDATLIQADRWLHGTDPWRILQPVLGYPIVTFLLNWAYQLWFILLYAGSLYFASYQQDRVLRAQYFIAFFCTWVTCGIVLAILFASVGPCFVHPILGNAHYAELMTYLETTDGQFHLPALDVQAQLLAWHHTGDHGLGRGISAMPSMHVSFAFLFYLAMRRVSPRIAPLFGAFFIMTLLGSIHLGYHYAVDGYLGILVTGIIWLLSRRVAELMVRENENPTPASIPVGLQPLSNGPAGASNIATGG